MLVFAASDKGGTGRTVTGCNIAYRLSLQGKDVSYLDFDFGSPTAGAIFEIGKYERGIDHGGLHSYVEGTVGDTHSVDVRANSDRRGLRTLQPKAGRLVFYPGNRGGAEFPCTSEMVERCVELFRRLEQEFEISVIDLSAGRSYAVQIALQATAKSVLQSVTARWLVFHRWTRQHIMAANGLVFSDYGVLELGKEVGHDPETLRNSIRFVRTAVPDLKSPLTADHAAQSKWLRTCHEDLKQLALRRKLGYSATLGETPMEPVLQWREQVILDADVSSNIANKGTVEAFEKLALKLTDEAAWEIL
ncbi:MAG: SCO2523 family variant P-loop protein [Pseudonocardiaceae bacterium]